MSNTYIDASMVHRALETIHQDGELFEIRVLGGRGPFSGYFKDIDKAVDYLSHMSAYDLRGTNIYVTLNPVMDACLAREQSNRIIKAKNQTKDEEITRLHWLFIDLDPVRITGISSSNKELAQAQERAVNVYKYLKKEGFPDPLIGMSGNGYHLLYRIDLPTTEAETVKTFLEAMGMLFTDDAIKIDAVNFNPSRICKLYGTLAQKGTGTDERPHRMAHIIKSPKHFEPVELEKIQKIAAMLPPKVEKKKGNRSTYTGQEFDIVEWMKRHGIEYREKAGDSYTKYILSECPFDPSHKAPDSMITKGDGGEIGFRCLHNSCMDKTWKDVRLKYEPDAYDKKDNYEDDGRIDAGWNEHKKMMARTRVNDIEEKENEAVQTQIEEDIPLTGPVEVPAPAPEMVFRPLKKAADLLKKDIPEPVTYIGVGEEVPLLVEGTCILSAKPKLGKSWLALALCLAVANGEDFLGYKTKKCSTLYLDLETGESLQQKRLKKALAGAACPDGFYLDGEARTLDTGLIDQIEYYMQQDPNIGIIVIDVFQKIRTASLNFKETEYEHAYRDFGPLNSIAQKYHISIIVVSHDRKTVDPDDPFANILGSVGLQGAVSQMMVMYQRRKGDPIHISVKGKTIDGLPELDVKLDGGQWYTVSAASSEAAEKAQLMQEYMDSSIRKAVLAIMTECSTWKGRCSSIINDAARLGVPVTDTAKAIGKFLHVHQGRMLEADGIQLEIKANGTASKTYIFSHYDPEGKNKKFDKMLTELGFEDVSDEW